MFLLLFKWQCCTLPFHNQYTNISYANSSRMYKEKINLGADILRKIKIDMQNVYSWMPHNGWLLQAWDPSYSFFKKMASHISFAFHHAREAKIWMNCEQVPHFAEVSPKIFFFPPLLVVVQISSKVFASMNERKDVWRKSFSPFPPPGFLNKIK